MSVATPSHPRPTLRSRPVLREMLDTIVFIIVVYVLVEMAAPRFLVEGPSMQPTFWDYQRLIISRVHYMVSDPERGDIVVFNSPNSRIGDSPLVKRAVGLPGDTLEFREAIIPTTAPGGETLTVMELYLNGSKMDEPYINEWCRPSSCPAKSWTLGADEYFLMGDNRNHSNDSRAFGAIHKNQIIGEALVRYWPPQSWALLKQYRYTALSNRRVVP
ncbi:signal peptidase I [bacterium]|nr:signal peptidase I [bacterium]